MDRFTYAIESARTICRRLLSKRTDGVERPARVIAMPKPVADALTQWQGQVLEGVPFVSFVLLTRERYEAVKQIWAMCREAQNVNGKSKRREWQNRWLVNNVLRTIRRDAQRAGIEPIAPITVHIFRKSFGQNHADNGTPMHVLQQWMGHAHIGTTREFYLRVAQGSGRLPCDTPSC